MSHSHSSLRRPIIFAMAYGLLLLVELSITCSSAFGRQPDLLAGAVVFDLAVLPAVLLYWLVVKPMGLSNTLLAALIISFVRVALLILPAGVVPFNISWPLLIALLEVGVLVVVLIRVHTLRQVYRTLRLEHDRATALQGSLTSVFGNRISTVLISESHMLRYSLLGWWRLSSDLAPEQQAVTTHRESGQVALTIALLLVGCMEGIIVHLVLMRWSPTLAFWVTALTAYSLLFLIADLVATCQRPSFLTANTFHVRLGIRWRADVSRANVATITWLTEKPARETGLLNGSFLVAANALLTLHEPIWVEGPYGLRRQVRKLALFIDDKPAFRRSFP